MTPHELFSTLRDARSRASTDPDVRDAIDALFPFLDGQADDATRRILEAERTANLACRECDQARAELDAYLCARAPSGTEARST